MFLQKYSQDIDQYIACLHQKIFLMKICILLFLTENLSVVARVAASSLVPLDRGFWTASLFLVSTLLLFYHNCSFVFGSRPALYFLGRLNIVFASGSAMV